MKQSVTDRQQKIAEQFGYKNMKEMISTEYKDKTCNQIAIKIGVSEACLFNRMKQYGVETKKKYRNYDNVSNSQIIALVSQGITYKKTAEKLHITEYVVNNAVSGRRNAKQKKQIKRKCKLCDRNCYPNFYYCKTCHSRISNTVDL